MQPKPFNPINWKKMNHFKTSLKSDFSSNSIIFLRPASLIFDRLDLIQYFNWNPSKKYKIGSNKIQATVWPLRGHKDVSFDGMKERKLIFLAMYYEFSSVPTGSFVEVLSTGRHRKLH